MRFLANIGYPTVEIKFVFNYSKSMRISTLNILEQNQALHIRLSTHVI